MSDRLEDNSIISVSNGEPKVFENGSVNFDCFTSPQTTQDIQTQAPTRRTRKKAQIRRADKRTNKVPEETNTTRSRYEDRHTGSPYRRRSTSQKGKSLDVNLNTTNTHARHTPNLSHTGDIIPNAQGTINASTLQSTRLDLNRPEDSQPNPMMSPSAFIPPLKRQASSANIMAESPDSGFYYNGSPLFSSPSPYRHCQPDGSSGVESDMDTSDLGTPTSETVVDLFQKTHTMKKTKSKQNTTKKLRMFLQKNYVSIKDDLDPEEVADILYQEDLIRKDDREKITEMKFRAEKGDKLIKSLVRKSLKANEQVEECFVKQVIDSFKKAKYGYLFKAFEEFTEPDNHEELPIDDTWKGKLSYFFATKGDEMDTVQVIDELLAKEVLTFDEHQSILDANTKKNKLKSLAESIQRKSLRHFNNYCNVMRDEYPEVSKMLFDESIYEKMDTALERCCSPTFEIKVLKEATHDEGETEVKLTVEGPEGAERELEKMVVDQHSPKPSEKLVAMVTDDIHCEAKISFSCIKVTLECMSERSRMLLLDKCKTTPYFLERWIKELFDADKINMLKQKKATEVKFKIQVNWPDFVLSRQDIARNYGYLREHLEPSKYKKIFRGIDGSQDVIKVISSEEAREVRCREFILFMVISEHAPLERLSAELRGTKMIEYVISQKRSKLSRSCTCKLTKEIIVKNFSLLEKEIEKVEEIIDIFAIFPGFDESVQSQFRAVNSKETNTSKTEEFLRRILDLPDDGFQVCLFEAALIRTQQDNLLRKMLYKAFNGEECLITKDDVSRNNTFLQQELEPMRFIPMLSQQNDTAHLREKILEAASRRHRCKLFLEYLRNCDSATMKTFSLELQRLHLTNIIGYLLSARHQGHAENTITIDDISQNRTFLEDVLDPMELRHILSDNEHDKSRQALDNVLRTPKKKRCKVFLDVLITSEEVVFKKLTTYLEKQMPYIIKFLVMAREHQDIRMRSVLESVLDAYSFIVSEIEPARLQTMFVERQVITDTDFASICSNPTRRGRAIELMQYVLKGPLSRTQCLIDALASAGYKSLTKQINDMQETFKPCPRLYRLNLGGKCVAFEGVVNIKFEQPEAEDKPNHAMSSSSSLAVNKEQYIWRWLHDSCDTATHKATADSKDTDAGPCISREPSATAKRRANERNEITDINQKSPKRNNIPDYNNSLFDYSTLDNYLSWCVSPTPSSQCRRFDETGEVCSQSDRSKSLTTFVEEDSRSRFTENPDLFDLVVNFDLVYPELTSTGGKNVNAKVHQISKSEVTPTKSKAVEESEQKAVCSCIISSEHVSPNDSKMGVCTDHALYYIQ